MLESKKFANVRPVRQYASMYERVSDLATEFPPDNDKIIRTTAMANA